MNFSYSVAEIAEICGPGRIEGVCCTAITGMASLAQAVPGDLSFLAGGKYRAALAETKASLILVPSQTEGAPVGGQAWLRVDNPSRALGQLCRLLEVRLWPRPAPGVHPSACVDPSARIAADAIVGPLCVIEAGSSIGARSWIEAGGFVGRDAKVGDDCRFFPGVKILAECEVGNRVILHPGVVVGSDGFGYDTVAGAHAKIPQVGRVIIQDDVEVGANTTIDRARFSATVIGRGAKIDNLVQVGHNSLIGRHCILCAQVGMAGTTTLEDYVVVGGQAGLGGHLTIGAGSMIAGQSGVTSDLPAKSKVKGNPPLPLTTEQRINALRKRLPDLFRRVDALEARVGTDTGSYRAAESTDDQRS